MNYDERKQLNESLQQLVKPEFEEIFRILKKNKESLTENNNGIFFNFMEISDTSCQQIKKFISFCMENRVSEMNRKKEMETLRKDIQ
jgi:dsDNA-specific endonuclease/ATPase MutS2